MLWRPNLHIWWRHPTLHGWWLEPHVSLFRRSGIGHLKVADIESWSLHVDAHILEFLVKLLHLLDGFLLDSFVDEVLGNAVHSVNIDLC